MIEARGLEPGAVLQPDWDPLGNTMVVVSPLEGGVMEIGSSAGFGVFCMAVDEYDMLPFTVVGYVDPDSISVKFWDEAWETYKAKQGVKPCPKCGRRTAIYANYHPDNLTRIGKKCQHCNHTWDPWQDR